MTKEIQQPNNIITNLIRKHNKKLCYLSDIFIPYYILTALFHTLGSLCPLHVLKLLRFLNNVCCLYNDPQKITVNLQTCISSNKIELFDIQLCSAQLISPVYSFLCRFIPSYSTKCGLQRGKIVIFQGQRGSRHYYEPLQL